MLFDRIHLWGDSVAKGVIYSDARKRYCISPNRCVVGLEEALGVPIINHARMGATATEGLADFAAAPADPGTLVVVEYGGNDCDMPWAEISERPDADYAGHVPLPCFEAAIHSFVDAVRARGMTPLLITPPPLEAGRYFEWVSNGLSKEAILRFLGDVQHIYRWQERYSNAIRRVALAARCTLFDMRDAFLACRRYPDMLCTDGIHPNDEGHALIAQAVIEAAADLSASLAV